MALTYDYRDKYLARLITQDIEDQASDDIDAISSLFSAAWKARLVPLRAYVILCLEAGTNDEDVFATKLEAYRRELKDQLMNAKTNTEDADGITLNTISVRVDRG